MAVYTHVDRASLEAFLSAYDLPPLVAHHGIEAGVENTNYLIETEGPRFILTLYEKRVDPDDLPFFLGLMDHLRGQGVDVPAPIRTQKGDVLGELCGRPAALVSFLQGKSEKTANPARARAAGALLAQLHLGVAGFEMTRPNALGPKAWVQMAADLGEGLDRIAPGLHAELTAEADLLKENWPETLPRGAVHADFFPDNVMFEGDEPRGVIDFYFACTDYFAYDLAIAMNAFTPEDALSPEDGLAMLEGYEAVRPLSDKERAALPFFLRGAALRFALTRAHDWLHQVPGSLVQVKNPTPWLELSRAHRQSPAFFEEAF